MRFTRRFRNRSWAKDLIFTFSLGAPTTATSLAARPDHRQRHHEFSPKVAYNASVTDQTFMSLSYQLIIDQYDNRPVKKTLDSHLLSARVAHAFTQGRHSTWWMFFNSRETPSRCSTHPLNATSHSAQRTRRQFYDGAQRKLGLIVKARTVDYQYRNASSPQPRPHRNLYGMS